MKPLQIIGRFLSRLFRRSRADLVPYYDFESGKTVLIPKLELSPGVVLVQIQGQAQPVYADTAQLKQGELRHPPFEGELRSLIESLADDLADVHPMSYEEWEDGFRRDQNPEPEIAGWIHLTGILKFMSKQFDYGPEERQECYRILVACFTGERDTVRLRTHCGRLPDEQVEQTIRYFYEGGYG